jgi:subtilisin family serine protease
MVYRLANEGLKAMRRLVQVIVCFALLAGSAQATQRLIVRVTLGQTLLNTTCLLLGCNVIEGLGDPSGQVFLLGVPDGVSLPSFITTLLSITGVVDAEADTVASLLQSTPPIPQSLYDNTPVSYYGTTVWQGYATQPAAQIVEIATAQSSYKVSGAGTVAVIDTGVDPNQAVLKPVLVSGYDFTRNMAGGSEMPDIPVTTQPTVTTPATFVNSYSAADLDESTDWVIDSGEPGQNGQYAAFGHGTMVSGVIHLVAPTASIMPLKAFQANGTGYTSDIIRAVYWAVLHNARVINMSFSEAQSSLELGLALDVATSAGTICVAAAGNSNSSMPVYPAAFSNVIGVASTSNSDVLSTFSNYGSWVWLAAPGEGIVTTYPWSTYAAAWGTSFSAPFVSGTVSLLLEAAPALSQTQAANAVGNAVPVGSGVGHGRLDILQALQSLGSSQ